MRASTDTTPDLPPACLHQLKPDVGGRGSLKMVLQKCWASNASLVKLVDQEDLGAEDEQHGDQSEDEHEAPNIGISHVTFTGCQVVLPAGVALSC